MNAGYSSFFASSCIEGGMWIFGVDLQGMHGGDHGSLGGKWQRRSIQSRPRFRDFVTRVFLQLSIHRLRFPSLVGQEYPNLHMALSHPLRGYRLLRTCSGK